MGWSFRKSLRILPGIRINLSKSGPRLSMGVPGARASVDLQGKTKLYGGVGPLRYQKTVMIGAADKPKDNEVGLLAVIRKVFGGR